MATATPRRAQPQLTLASMLADLQQLGRDRSLLPSVEGLTTSTSVITAAPTSPGYETHNLDYTSSQTALYQPAHASLYAQRDDFDPQKEASKLAVKVASDFLETSNEIVDKVEDGIVERLRDRIDTAERRAQDVLGGLRTDHEPQSPKDGQDER
ncbi:hypothetical protein OIV83_003755 [Microbotryomycetes sp. JL201]|nr:hypothetical protein OIV83_003755 [Microbotryomycetes sp. JL201]